MSMLLYILENKSDKSPEMLSARKIVKDIIANELSGAQSEYFIMKYIEGLSTAEICEIVNRKETTISATLKRARQRFRRILRYADNPVLVELREDMKLREYNRKGEKELLE